MERTSRRGRMLGAILMVFGAMTLFMAGTAGAASVDPVLNPPTENEPEGDSNPSCEDLGYDIEAKYDAQAESGDSGTASGDGLVVDWKFGDDGLIDFEVDETSEYAVAVAIVKQASEQSGGGAYVYYYEPPVLSDTDLIDPREDGQFSHITFCGGDLPEEEEEEEASLTIVKVVDADAPEDWSVDFTGDAGTFTLGATEGDTEGPQTVAPGTYVVTETLVPTEFTLTDITCTGADSFTPDTGTGSVSVTLADGDDATCTFTNDYPLVLGEVVTRTPETPTAPVSPAAQPTQVESLAFTGSGTERLAVAGVALVLLGSVLVLGDRRRRAQI